MKKRYYIVIAALLFGASVAKARGSYKTRFAEDDTIGQ